MRINLLMRRPSHSQPPSAAVCRNRGILLVTTLAAFSAALWLVTLGVFKANPAWLALAAAAYGFGLRHGFDADHIAAIDGITRRQLAAGKHSTYVGLQFSLGHSTVVVALALLLIFGIHQVSGALPQLVTIGGVIGGGFSAILLLMVGMANIWTLITISPASAHHSHNAPGGLLNWLFQRTYRYVTSGWKVFCIGLLFGLGFDTASEIAVLIIASEASVHGIPPWYCIIFPLLFTAGMTLVDSADTVLISSACRWALQTTRRSHAYNIAMTLTTVVMALGIAAIELWGLLATPVGRHSGAASWADILNAHFVALGGSFVVVTMLLWATLWLLARRQAAAAP